MHPIRRCEPCVMTNADFIDEKHSHRQVKATMAAVRPQETTATKKVGSLVGKWSFRYLVRGWASTLR